MNPPSRIFMNQRYITPAYSGTLIKLNSVFEYSLQYTRKTAILTGASSRVRSGSPLLTQVEKTSVQPGNQNRSFGTWSGRSSPPKSRRSSAMPNIRATRQRTGWISRYPGHDRGRPCQAVSSTYSGGSPMGGGRRCLSTLCNDWGWWSGYECGSKNRTQPFIASNQAASFSKRQWTALESIIMFCGL